MDEAGALAANELVAAAVRAEMARKRMLQSTLAAALGVSGTYIYRRLNAETPLSVVDLARIADELDVTISSLTAVADGMRT